MHDRMVHGRDMHCVPFPMPLAPPVTTTTRGRACPPAAAAAAAWPHDRKATAARSMATPVVVTLVCGCCTSTPENTPENAAVRVRDLVRFQHPSKKVQTLAREKKKSKKWRFCKWRWLFCVCCLHLSMGVDARRMPTAQMLDYFLAGY
jgi:hypothetical protein